MHRHQYKGKKLGRERDQRISLMKGLADSLIENESIETTLAKAKELVPYAEKLITKAKNPNLANRRLVIAKVNTVQAANKLLDDISPKLSGRTGGHLRVEKTTQRRGDNAQLAKVSFVDDLSTPAPKQSAKPKQAVSAKTATDSKPQKASTKTAPNKKAVKK